MSISTWTAEFYTPASECKTVIEALRHGAKKWTGFSPENLEKHELNSRQLFFLTAMPYSPSCALCNMFASQCEKCPLTLSGNCCNSCTVCKDDKDGCEDTCTKQSLWRMAHTDPLPLITELERLLQEELKKGDK